MNPLRTLLLLFLLPQSANSSTSIMTTLSPDTDGDNTPPIPLPFTFKNNHNPRTNETVTSDSKSLFINGERFFQIGGEIHFARVPHTQWREELSKIKAGGLNTVSVYLFWIHHEEEENVFTFSENKDVRAFLLLAQALDLKVNFRVGPWCHGEVRNGGHPSWIATQTTHPRTATDPKYLSYVDRLFQNLATQLDGLWWHQGGPILFTQLDNETGE